MALSSRFDEAFQFASDLHRTQTRKSSGTPYIAHLMAVAAIALEYGATEDEAIAALLHDAVEDLVGAPYSVRLVVAADKLHNVQSVLADYRRLHEELWPRFTGGKDGTLWFYR